MEMTLACPTCRSAIDYHPKTLQGESACKICSHHQTFLVSKEFLEGKLSQCPCCQRKDFYRQKDFNRRAGVVLFIIAAILSVKTYGISLFVLFVLDFILFQKLRPIVICYNCETVFRYVENHDDFSDFDHEMHDRIVYSGHDFEGRSPH